MSAYEGSEMQMRDEDARARAQERGHGIDTCRCGAVLRQCRCIGPHIPRVVQETCPKCKAATAAPDTKPIGTRRVSLEVSAADLRRLVGAPSSAIVEVVPEVNHGPNGKTEARVIVSWREGA